MDDLGRPGRFPPCPETATSGYYGASIRTAGRLVRSVPHGWPSLVRRPLQILLALVAAVFVLFAWILATIMLLVSSLGGSASARY
jgi:hypothetical protein